MYTRDYNIGHVSGKILGNASGLFPSRFSLTKQVVRRRKRSRTPISDRERKRKRGRRKSKRGRMKWGTSHIGKKYLNSGRKEERR